MRRYLAALPLVALTSPAAHAGDVWIYYHPSYITSTEVAPLVLALEGAGADVDISTSSDWPTSWTGYQLVVILLPAAAFSSAQADGLLDMVNGGGRLVISGDWESAFTTFNNYADDLLSAMGVSMSLGGTKVAGSGCATATSLGADQVTEDVSAVLIAAGTWVTGGTPLVSYGGATLLAYDQPESAPSTRTPYDVLLSGDVNLLLNYCSGSTTAGRNATLWENLYLGLCRDEDGDGARLLDCGGDDCDDDDASAFPGAEETPYDGLDQDCDGADLIDLDGDGWEALAAGGDDCDDSDALAHPGASETADGADEDCDGLIDEGTDSYDDDGDGWTEEGGDCDDGDADVRPGAGETSDGADEDCDGLVDEGTDSYDDDGDGFTEDEGDCSDGDAAVSPDAAEIAGNGVDDDCDGTVDDGVYDADGDGWTEEGGDCDGADAAVNPGAPETADGRDEDCDGLIDEGTDASDDDGDGLSETQGDCDDSDAGVLTGGAEVDNGRDDDCDGLIDEGTDASDDDAVDEGLTDLDADGVRAEEGDCDDGDGWVSPNVAEMCDGVDNDCDEAIDEGCGALIVDGEITDGGDGCGCATGDGAGAGGAALAGLLLAGLGARRRRG